MTEKYKCILKSHRNIKKSDNDNRSYLGLELVNGLCILLISDSDTDVSAAVLKVRVDYMSDPIDLPGLAHFCEHLLFLGNEKYKIEDEFSNFLNQHNGNTNAMTIHDETHYYFDVDSNSLKDAIDRFVHFFLCPSFDENSVEKEVNAIESEFQKNLLNDYSRISAAEKVTCNLKHDYNKFDVGNIETLWNIPKSKGIKIRNEVKRFYENYYSANIMSLVVYGKEPIEELIDITVPLFVKIPNKNIQMVECKTHPFDPDFMKHQLYVVPIRDRKLLKVTFPLPDFLHLYKSKPQRYLTHLIENECSGSLITELKKCGWIIELEAECSTYAKGFGFCNIEFCLTEEGLEHINDIMTLFFQYLAFLKEKGPQEWIFEECKNIASLSFRYRSKTDPLSYVRSLAKYMFCYPIEDILCHSDLFQCYEPDTITGILDLLVPDKMRICIVAKKFESLCTDVEKWYGTRFKCTEIPEQLLQAWKNVIPLSTFRLPLPNVFILESSALVSREQNNVDYPQLIKNTSMVNLWYKNDDKFLIPKAILLFQIESPMIYLDPLNFNLSILFEYLVNDSLTEYIHIAGNAGLFCSIDLNKGGLFIGITGYNDKQHILLKKIMDKLTNFQIDSKRFEIMKEELHRCYKDFKTRELSTHGKYYTSMLLEERFFTCDDLLFCFEEVTFEKMQEFIPKIFSYVHVQALMYGNLERNHALTLMDIVESTLTKNANSKYLKHNHLTRFRDVKLLDGHSYVYEFVSDIHNCSAIMMHFQCGIRETLLNVLLELLNLILSRECFNVLRTQEQLGYIVISRILRTDNVQGINIYVQTNKLPCYVEERIEVFLNYFEKYLQDMKENDFKAFVKSLSQSRLEKPKSLNDQGRKYWSEIVSKHYKFDRDNNETSVLSTITKQDLCAFFKEYFSCDAPKRKQLSIHLKASDKKEVNKEKKNEQISEFLKSTRKCPEKIQNVEAFKSRSELYPLVVTEPICMAIS